MKTYTLPGPAILAPLGLALLVVTLLAIPAAAYEAHVGDRAQDFAGYDVVGQRTVRLEDYAGHWVLVDFWATWCGPCMEELPNLLKQTAPYRASGQLAVVSVSCDSAEGLKRLKQTVHKLGIDYPVLYDGGEFRTVPASEWQVDAIPAAYLIDPQGVIVASGVRGAELSQILDFYLNGQRPVLGLRTHSQVNDDGTVSIFAELSNPARTPVQLTLVRKWEIWPFRPDGTLDRQQRTQRKYDWHAAEVTVQFDDFGEATHEFRLTPPAEANFFGYGLTVLVPDSVGQVGEDGMHFSTDRDQAYVHGMVYRDGDFRLLQGEDAQRWRPKSDL